MTSCFNRIPDRLVLPAVLISSLVASSHADDTRRERSFRPIVPIKQNVKADDGGGQKSQTLSVQIPPPPIPDSSTSLFPEGSVPELDLKPGSEVEIAVADKDQDTPPDTSKKTKASSSAPASGPTLSQLRHEAHLLASKGLTYKFGVDDVDKGGLDCSSTIQYLLEKIGVKGCPRTSYDQYYWLKRKKLLDDVYGKQASKKLLKKLSPGDLIFWGGTWKSGHRVSHVMLYMGYDPQKDKHYVFGARGKKSKGLLGHGVDIFELDTERGRLIAHGKIPGLIYD